LAGSRSFDSNFIPVIQLVTFSVEGRVLAAMQANGVSTPVSGEMARSLSE
jgi:hypothetical protein